MGCTSAIVFTCFGAAYGTAKAGVGVSAMGVLRPDLIVKSTFHLIELSLRDSALQSPRAMGEEETVSYPGSLTALQTLSPSSWLVSLVSTVSSSPS